VAADSKEGRGAGYGPAAAPGEVGMDSPDNVIYCFDCNGLHVEGECTHSDTAWAQGGIPAPAEDAEEDTGNSPWGRLFDFRAAED